MRKVEKVIDELEPSELRLKSQTAGSDVDGRRQSARPHINVLPGQHTPGLRLYVHTMHETRMSGCQ